MPASPFRFVPLLLALLPGPALAASGPVGIGFVQAEEGTWSCRAADPDKAFDCAAKKCAKEANGQDCHPTRWCFPAGWSGTMVVWLSEFHQTAPLCGAPTSDSVTEALKSLCAGFDDANHCDLTAIIDPDGNEKSIDGVSWSGPVLTPPEDPAEPADPTKP